MQPLHSSLSKNLRLLTSFSHLPNCAHVLLAVSPHKRQKGLVKMMSATLWKPRARHLGWPRQIHSSHATEMFVNARNGFASKNARRFRGCKRKMNNKRNVVLYLDKDLAEKTRELGFNLPKTFENHLKQLTTQFSNVNSVDDSDSWSGFSSPGETRTLGSDFSCVLSICE